MILRYTQSALADLAEISSYIAQDRPAVSADVGRQIRSAIARLANLPYAGRPGRVEGTRELVIPRLPYIVAYQVVVEHVNILAILHSARRWPSSFDPA